MTGPFRAAHARSPESVGLAVAEPPSPGSAGRNRSCSGEAGACGPRRPPPAPQLPWYRRSACPLRIADPRPAGSGGDSSSLPATCPDDPERVRKSHWPGPGYGPANDRQRPELSKGGDETGRDQAGSGRVRHSGPRTERLRSRGPDSPLPAERLPLRGHGARALHVFNPSLRAACIRSAVCRGRNAAGTDSGRTGVPSGGRPSERAGPFHDFQERGERENARLISPAGEDLPKNAVPFQLVQNPVRGRSRYPGTPHERCAGKNRLPEHPVLSPDGVKGPRSSRDTVLQLVVEVQNGLGPG